MCTESVGRKFCTTLHFLIVSSRCHINETTLMANKSGSVFIHSPHKLSFPRRQQEIRNEIRFDRTTTLNKKSFATSDCFLFLLLSVILYIIVLIGIIGPMMGSSRSFHRQNRFIERDELFDPYGLNSILTRLVRRYPSDHHRFSSKNQRKFLINKDKNMFE